MKHTDPLILGIQHVVDKTLCQFLKDGQKIVTKVLMHEDNKKHTLHVYSHWMSLILIAGPAIKIVFKVHFQSKAAWSLAAPAFGLSIDNLSVEKSCDFMREFCNLAGGKIKLALSNSNIETGISLPMLTRGFDDLFLEVHGRKNTRQDYWSCQFEEHYLIFSTIIQSSQQIDFSFLTKDYLDNLSKDNDIEFL